MDLLCKKSWCPASSIFIAVSSRAQCARVASRRNKATHNNTEKDHSQREYISDVVKQVHSFSLGLCVAMCVVFQSLPDIDITLLSLACMLWPCYSTSPDPWQLSQNIWRDACGVSVVLHSYRYCIVQRDSLWRWHCTSTLHKATHSLPGIDIPQNP